MDHIESLNVGAILLSSFYQSDHDPANDPDYGYEVTDHKAIEGVYGDDEDFDQLLEEAHNRGGSLLFSPQIKQHEQFTRNFNGARYYICQGGYVLGFIRLSVCHTLQ